MPLKHPCYPAVNAALAAARKKRHGGCPAPLSDEQREMASRFDVAQALADALEARRRAGLNPEPPAR